MLQELCRDGIEWDDPELDHNGLQWEEWRLELPLLEEMKILRCVKPSQFGDPVKIELRKFSDASDMGLGQVTFLRLVNASNQVHFSFLMGKACVASIELISAPFF